MNVKYTFLFNLFKFIVVVPLATLLSLILLAAMYDLLDSYANSIGWFNLHPVPWTLSLYCLTVCFLGASLVQNTLIIKHQEKHLKISLTTAFAFAICALFISSFISAFAYDNLSFTDRLGYYIICSSLIMTSPSIMFATIKAFLKKR